MKRRSSLLWMILLFVVSCASPSDGGSPGSFTAPPPPNEFASGLTIGFVPEGFDWVWNEGHETATFHTFQTEDESEQIWVGIQMSPPPHPGTGEPLSRGGRDFVVYDSGTEVRVTEDLGNDIRIDVVSASLDTETLLRIAESVAFDPTVTSTTVPVASPGELVVPDCDDTGLCAAGFVLDDGIFYGLSCRAVRDAEVSDEVLGRGQLEGEEVTVNAVEGIDRDVMVAVSLPGGLCHDGAEALSGWSVAFPSTVDDAVARETLCQVGELTEAQRVADGC